MKNIAIFCFILILAGFSCKKANEKDAGLLKVKWVLSYIKNTKTNAITNYPGEASRKISIVFSDTTNNIEFSGVCNEGRGTYSYSFNTGAIKITDLFTTQIGCQFGEWETYTLQSLSSSLNYKIDGNDLVIYTSGEYNLYFTKN